MVDTRIRSSWNYHAVMYVRSWSSGEEDLVHILPDMRGSLMTWRWSSLHSDRRVKFSKNKKRMTREHHHFVRICSVSKGSWETLEFRHAGRRRTVGERVNSLKSLFNCWLVAESAAGPDDLHACIRKRGSSSSKGSAEMRENKRIEQE